MFSGILTKILLGALGLSLIWGGANYVKWNYWDKPRYLDQIKKLAEEKIEWEVKAKARETALEILDKQNKITVRVTRDDQEVFKTEAAGDNPRIDQLLINRGLLNPDSNDSQDRSGGGAGRKTNAPPPQRAIN